MDKSAVKTTVVLPGTLWERAKKRAVEERTDFRSLVIEGLEMRLRAAPKKGGK